MGTSKQFIEDSIQNQVSEKIRANFFKYFRYNPPEAEVRSWQNSLRAMSMVIQHAGLLDHGILLEYQLPMTSRRLDCLISGRNQNGADSAVIVELKQWDKCGESNADYEVMTWVGGNYRDVLHPSAQVGQYQLYLQDTHTAFYEGQSPVQLNSCVYMHNYHYRPGDILFSEKFSEVLSQFPLYTGDDVNKLTEFLKKRLARGGGLDVLDRIDKSEYRPSKKLMDHVGSTIKGNSEYILLDEQKVVYDKVFAEARSGFHERDKAVLIVKGGPGTGKSVIAINLMSDLLLEGYNVHYATGSRAFTETLRDIIGRRGAVQFKYFNSYMDASENEIDVLICDEAHRIRYASHNRFTPRARRTGIPQIEELIRSAKVAVFFIDDHQVVRPDEIGSVKYIKDRASEYGCQVMEYELEAQFRCNGSEGFINWINNTLGIRRTANVIWEQGSEKFDFKVFSSPFELEEAIRKKAAEGYMARMTAGFCWDWSKDMDLDGMLTKDVVIGSYKRPWNARPEARKLPPGVPRATLWAHDPRGINQVGCVYTAQGFEFDYVGVIFGKDLAYDLDQQAWVGDKSFSYDNVVKRSKGRFTDLVKNTYRVLLTRGMKGCYVYFMDRDTERFFKSRME